MLGALLSYQDQDLFNRVALQEYVLIAAQAQTGGLRDKPGKGVDAYHSCYNLSGLAAAQHVQVYADATQRSDLDRDWSDINSLESFEAVRGAEESSDAVNKRMKDVFVAALAWKEVEERKIIIGLEENETCLNHPVYNLEMEHLERMLRWSYGQAPKVSIEEIA
jgi:protein farnesyltransferase subunit beta